MCRRERCVAHCTPKRSIPPSDRAVSNRSARQNEQGVRDHEPPLRVSPHVPVPPDWTGDNSPIRLLRTFRSRPQPVIDRHRERSNPQVRDLREGTGGAKSEAKERTSYGPSCVSPRQDDGAAEEGRGEGPPNCVYPCDAAHRKRSSLGLGIEVRTTRRSLVPLRAILRLAVRARGLPSVPPIFQRAADVRQRCGPEACPSPGPSRV